MISLYGKLVEWFLLDLVRGKGNCDHKEGL